MERKGREIIGVVRGGEVDSDSVDSGEGVVIGAGGIGTTEIALESTTTGASTTIG